MGKGFKAGRLNALILLYKALLLGLNRGIKGSMHGKGNWLWKWRKKKKWAWFGKGRATKREKKYQFGRSFGFFTNELYAWHTWMKECWTFPALVTEFPRKGQCPQIQPEWLSFSFQCFSLWIVETKYYIPRKTNIFFPNNKDKDTKKCCFAEGMKERIR